MIVDSHFHLWRTARGDYDWLADEDASLSVDFDVDDWRENAGAAGVTRGILVQATPTLDETRFLLGIAAQAPDQILGVVGWCDLTGRHAALEIASFVEDGRVVAIRSWLQAMGSAEWLAEGATLTALQYLSTAGLRFEALARPVHLAHLDSVAKRVPQLSIVLDHGAKPRITSPDEFDQWATDIYRLSTNPNVYCKLSGLLTEAPIGLSHESLRRYTDVILDAFGPTRTLWGSDWPVVTTRASYAQWFRTAQALVPAEWADDVFHRSALRAYGIPTSFKEEK